MRSVSPFNIAVVLALVALAAESPAAELGRIDAAGPTATATVDRASQAIANLQAPGALIELHEAVVASVLADRVRILDLIAQRRCRAARELVTDLLAGDADQTIPALRTMAVLGRGTPETVDKVVNLCSAPVERVRIAAIDCLAAWSDRRFLSVFISKLGDGGAVAAAAERGLMAFSDAPHGRDPQAWRAWYDSRFVPMEKKAAGLVTQLRSHDPKQVVDAIQALTLYSDLRAEHADVIAPLQTDRDPAVADAAITAMRTLRPEECLQPKLDRNHRSVPVAVAITTAPPRSTPMIKGLFDTWVGFVVVASGSLFIISSALFLLRSPKVRAVTERFVAPTARAVGRHTQRIARPIAAQIEKRLGPVARSITQRIARGTRRFTKPITQRIGRATEQLLRPVRPKQPVVPTQQPSSPTAAMPPPDTSKA